MPPAASSAAAPCYRLYDGALQAIQQQQCQGGQQENSSTTDERQQQHQHQHHQDLLEDKLDRMIEEANQSSIGSSESNRQARIVGTKRQRQGEQAKTPAGMLAAQQAGDVDYDSEAAVEEGVPVEGGLEDKCLGVFAEAFADDLDLLRKDEHFRGSARNIAAMADMMR